MAPINAQFLIGKNILFIVPLKAGVSSKEYIEEGSVLSAYDSSEEATVCFMYGGYKSTCEIVPFANILSVLDTEGSDVKIDVFSGKGHDLRGKAPFGTHLLAHKS